MGRWEPDAAGRLREAALILFEEHGFEQTTVAEIAARAGLTERTFFRHFADKREVLFRGSEQLRDALIAGLDAARPGAGPLEAVTAALEALDGVFDREFASRRREVILANPELQERELIKLATLSDALAAALARRGVADSLAALAAETGMAVFRITFERWVTDRDERPWAVHLHETLGEFGTLSARAPASA